jgi:hypothetical protein
MIRLETQLSKEGRAIETLGCLCEYLICDFDAGKV